VYNGQFDVSIEVYGESVEVQEEFVFFIGYALDALS